MGKDVFRRAIIQESQGRLLVGLVPLGTLAGIVFALGVARGSALELIACFAACMIGRGILTEDPPSAKTAISFLTISWAVLVPSLEFSSFDLSATAAAGLVVGPGWVAGTPLSVAAVLIGGAAGLLGAAIWVESLPAARTGPLDPILRLGETALAATAVSATVFGPSIGVLLHGPLDAPSAAASGFSFAITIGAVAFVSAARKWVRRLEHPAVLWSVSAAVLAALAVAGS